VPPRIGGITNSTGLPARASASSSAHIVNVGPTISREAEQRKRSHMRKGFCHHCGHVLEFEEKVFRNDTCSNCGSDVCCCLNCSEYSETAPNQCREPEADKVSVKDRRNFCDYFKLQEGAGTSKAADKAAEARRKLEALFKKG
jgi:hypothetical protein